MDHLTKEQINALLRIEGEPPDAWFGNFDLFVKGFGRDMKVSIALGIFRDGSNLSERTVQTINELANLTEEHYQQILRLMFDDAMVAKEESTWGDSSSPPENQPTNWLGRLFSSFTQPGFVELAADDPRHPLFGINTPKDIEAKIEWEGFYVDDGQETAERIAFLTCYPPWEEEHGREIAICNGVPISINPIELNPYFYVDPESDSPQEEVTTEDLDLDESVEDEFRVRVWSGFYSLSDVLDIISDGDEYDEVEQAMVEQFAKSEFQAKRAAEATWPSVTDCDRLDEAFAALNSLGIVALQNAGYTISDGLSDVNEELANRDPDQVRGYCFYHEQDVGRAVDGHGLWLAFGDLADTASGKREIGQLIKAELERHGFLVDWNGDPETRIELPKLVWQRRSPTE